MSPGYPYQYQNEIECIYTLEAAEDFIIKIEIMEFDLEERADCGHDALEFRDGYSEFSPVQQCVTKRKDCFETTLPSGRFGKSPLNEPIKFCRYV